MQVPGAGHQEEGDPEGGEEEPNPHLLLTNTNPPLADLAKKAVSTAAQWRQNPYSVMLSLPLGLPLFLLLGKQNSKVYKYKAKLVCLRSLIMMPCT